LIRNRPIGENWVELGGHLLYLARANVAKIWKIWGVRNVNFSGIKWLFVDVFALLKYAGGQVPAST
jgi:hypothetical protein